MSQPRVAHIQSRFAARAQRGRGVSMAEAVAAADAAVGEIRGDGLREVERLLLAARRLADLGDAAAVAELQATADSIIGLCGVFGPAAVSMAALSLRQLLDATAPAPPSVKAVKVHIEAMQLLWAATPDERAAMAMDVLEALRGLVAFPSRRPLRPADGS